MKILMSKAALMQAKGFANVFDNNVFFCVGQMIMIENWERLVVENLWAPVQSNTHGECKVEVDAMVDLYEALENQGQDMNEIRCAFFHHGWIGGEAATAEEKAQFMRMPGKGPMYMVTAAAGFKAFGGFECKGKGLEPTPVQVISD